MAPWSARNNEVGGGMSVETQIAKACPVCGSPMVRAVARVGSRAGKPLWRCSDFDCRGLVNIDETASGSVQSVAPRPGESAQAEFERLRAHRTERVRRLAPFLAA